MLMKCDLKPYILFGIATIYPRIQKYPITTMITIVWHIAMQFINCNLLQSIDRYRC